MTHFTYLTQINIKSVIMVLGVETTGDNESVQVNHKNVFSKKSKEQIIESEVTVSALTYICSTRGFVYTPKSRSASALVT